MFSGVYNASPDVRVVGMKWDEKLDGRGRLMAIEHCNEWIGVLASCVKGEPAFGVKSLSRGKRPAERQAGVQLVILSQEKSRRRRCGIGVMQFTKRRCDVK